MDYNIIYHLKLLETIKSGNLAFTTLYWMGDLCCDLKYLYTDIESLFISTFASPVITASPF